MFGHEENEGVPMNDTMRKIGEKSKRVQHCIPVSIMFTVIIKII